MQNGEPQHSAARSAHPHVDLGRVALVAMLVNVRGGVLHQDPSLHIVCNDLHLDGVHINELVVNS